MGSSLRTALITAPSKMISLALSGQIAAGQLTASLAMVPYGAPRSMFKTECLFLKRFDM